MYLGGVRSLEPDPAFCYHKYMVSLRDMKRQKLDVDLRYLASLLESCGMSYTVPVDSDGAVSLPYAISLICGIQREPYCDDFRTLVESVPSTFRARFIMCWEAIEMDVGGDMVVWSESVGEQETVRALRSLAKTIELS